MGTETAAGGSSGALGMLGTGLQLAGVIGSTVGAYKKSSGEQQGYQFQSTIAKKNAAIAEMQSKDAMLRGVKDEQNVRMRTAQVASTQRASMAARGIDIGEGSPLNILTDTAFMGERDALTARDNSAKEVWGFQTQAQNYRDNASVLDWRADQTSPGTDAFATLLTGGGKVASSWYSLRNTTTSNGTSAP